MGDMLSLIEKAQANIDTEKAAEMERKMRNAEFTFDDFLEQMEQVNETGPNRSNNGYAAWHEQDEGRQGYEG